MPTYEYECKKCGHKFDALQQMSAAPLKTCPKCKGPVRRLISAGAGIIFKGSGFYETDYKNKRKKTEPKKPEGCAGAKDNQACKGCPANEAKKE